MTYDIFTDISLNKNQIKQFAYDNLSAAPSSPVVGQTYFDTVLGYPRTWDGSAWQAGSAAGDKFATNVGDGLALSYPVTHNLGTKDVSVTVFNIATGAEVLAAVTHTSTSVVTIVFTIPPALNAYRVVVMA